VSLSEGRYTSVTKKFSWEVDKTSLILRVEDGDKKTEWKIRKSTNHEVLRETFEGIQLALWEGYPMREMVRTVDAEELAELQKAWEEKSSTAVQANTEEASRAAQAARVAQLTSTAKWYEDDDEESMFVAALPDYDTGEI